MNRWFQYIIQGAIVLLIVSIVGSPMIRWVRASFPNFDVGGTEGMWSGMVAIAQNDVFAFMAALLALILISIFFRNNGSGKVSQYVLAGLSAFLVFVVITPRLVGDWQTNMGEVELGAHADSTIAVVQGLNAQIVIAEKVNELASIQGGSNFKSGATQVIEYVQPVGGSESTDVIAQNFVVPATGKVIVDLQNKACVANSNLGSLIGKKIAARTITFTSNNTVDEYHRIWLYDQGRSPNCKARYDELFAQGKIF